MEFHKFSDLTAKTVLIAFGILLLRSTQPRPCPVGQDSTSQSTHLVYSSQALRALNHGRRSVTVTERLIHLRIFIRQPKQTKELGDLNVVARERDLLHIVYQWWCVTVFLVWIHMKQENVSLKISSTSTRRAV